MSSASGETLIKEDRDTRVVGQPDRRGARIVRKDYVVRGAWRTLRTFLQRSRGEREFDNLCGLAAAGIAAVSPLAWGEVRRWGCVRRSWIETRMVGAAADLRDLARVQRCGRELLATYGRLLARLHASGFVSTTAYPRNVIVQRRGGGPRLWLCDQPDLQRSPGSWPAVLASVDLYDAAFSPSRRRELAAAARLRIVLGYTGGDRLAARRLWRRLAGRPRPVQRLLKGTLRFSGVVRRAAGGGRSGSAARPRP